MDVHVAVHVTLDVNMDVHVDVHVTLDVSVGVIHAYVSMDVYVREHVYAYARALVVDSELAQFRQKCKPNVDGKSIHM
jgi:hypothetical protein